MSSEPKTEPKAKMPEKGPGRTLTEVILKGLNKEEIPWSQETQDLLTEAAEEVSDRAIFNYRQRTQKKDEIIF